MAFADEQSRDAAGQTQPTISGSGTMTDAPITSFEQLRDAAVSDLRSVAKFINDAADEVAKGDIAQFDAITDEKLSLWREMLMIRQSVRIEELETARDAVETV